MKYLLKYVIGPLLIIPVSIFAVIIWLSITVIFFVWDFSFIGWGPFEEFQRHRDDMPLSALAEEYDPDRRYYKSYFHYLFGFKGDAWNKSERETWQ